MKLIKRWFDLELHTKILIGLILGIILGFILGPTAKALKPFGSLFIRLIRMVIIPLVFSSLVVGAASIGDPKSLGRIGGKTIAFYLVTTAFAVIIGLLMGNILQPGVNLNMDVGQVTMQAKEPPALSETLLNIVPKNPIMALQQGNMLQIIVFSLVLGVTLTLIGDKGKPVLEFFDSLAETMYKMTAMVMELAPYGVLALIASVVGSFGLSVLLPLIKVIIAVYIGCLIHWLITYGGAIKFFSQLKITEFFKGISSAQIFAFSTCSSSGTLPVTTKCCRENLGASDKITSFVLPLGATVNMDGTALYQGVCALFVAQVYGLDLSIAQQLVVVLTATLASIGTAGVPSAGLIMLTLTLKSVGLPLEGVALIAGIDRILDMARTVTNITGDSAATVIVGSSEDEIDLEVANNKVVNT
ncbi:Na+/H+ dicarboxylate symporter [Halobacteroides halobius DSM 5150]|uniref:Na+/H+ dicarboxylate symporter n=1 Tax=Halobacteroides halobius (strain ATCC 35273 / DSM 5150 / MD-1) TaxID=748449 RepID=L0K954_HALHC|nr:dicarboxylate/amino acid:cation symporter [Halobacteroides halobius]AGB41085.1 Na+/H+ dicarboxylate symporter [Halobacteroides halobius DSM 5150]